MTGISDSFQRPINYLRISVTDRCNLRCVYCMPAAGVSLISHGDILSYEEIHKVVEAAAEVDDKLIEKYLEGGELTQEELSSGLRKAAVNGKLVPIFTGSALRNIGFGLFLDAICDLLPSAKERKVVTITDSAKQEIEPVRTALWRPWSSRPALTPTWASLPISVSIAVPSTATPRCGMPPGRAPSASVSCLS